MLMARTAAGLLAGVAVNRAACACFALAAATGVYLIWVGGWPIFLLGVLSIFSGWAYTGGPLTIAYTALGELFVVAFFGLGAVCGTCTGRDLTGAVLLVNNHRDADANARGGRRTLAIVTGPTVTTWIYAALMLIPFGLLFTIGQALPRGHAWPALMVLPFTGILIHRFAHEPRGQSFNQILVQTVKIQAAFSLLLAIGLAL
jgi:1,4-dihydroxy-2-naphthoate polyprenyltransferase